MNIDNSTSPLKSIYDDYIIYIKDESKRLGQNSFKSLGCLYAVCKLLYPTANSVEEAVLQSDSRSFHETLITASDGNHGAALAFVGKKLSHAVKIYLPIGVSDTRKKQIMKLGAGVIESNLSYDQTVLKANEDAIRNGYTLIQDTSWEGYEKIPRLIMDGYSKIAYEAMKQCSPTHVFLQVGVGSFAASMCQIIKRQNPCVKIISVESRKSSCLFESLEKNKRVTKDDGGTTVCQGLDCGTLSLIAWDILKTTVDYWIKVEDIVSLHGLNYLSKKGILSGESGAAISMGTLIGLKERKRLLGINKKSRILIFNTEAPINSTWYPNLDLIDRSDIILGRRYGLDPNSQELESRTRNVQSKMIEKQLDVILLTNENDFVYFTGLYSKFWYSPTRHYYLIIPRQGKPIALVPSIIGSCFQKTWLGSDNVVTWDYPSENLGVSILLNIIKKHFKTGVLGMMMGGGTKVRLPLNAIMNIQNDLDRDIVDCTKLMENIRAVKTPYEINCIKSACGFGNEAFKKLPGSIETFYKNNGWISEKKIQDIMRILLIEEGVDDAPYVMVQSGSNGYDNILLEPSDRILKKGDIFVIDIGCVYRGYWCDFDRNYSIGEPAKILSDAHSLLWDSVQRGFNILKVGVKASEIYNEMIKGLNIKNGGRFGHGIGLQLTEHLSLQSTDHTPLKAGYVITLEPGINIGNGKILVHEENVLITEKGPVMLSERTSKTIPVINLN